MKVITNRYWIALAIGVCMAILFCHTPASQSRPLDQATADMLAQAALTAWDVPGAAVVIVTRDRVLYVKGYGVRERGKPEPVDVDTIFPLASCSKAFTSLLISQLADDGRMSWDDGVRKYLPDFHLSDPVADAGVAVRDLLCHRTGLASNDFLWYHSPLSQDEIIARCASLPLTKPFRTAFQYQNMMAMAGGMAASKAGGKPWDALVRERILEPLGMTNTSCVTPANNRATPHRPNADGKLEPIAWYEQKSSNPANSIHTTPRDLANWLMFQLGDGTFGGKRLVSTAGLAETHLPQIPQRLEGLNRVLFPDTVMMSYGLGWVIHDHRGHLLWSHTGLIDGFRAQIALAPRDGIGVAVLSNRFETRMNLALINSLLDRLLDLPARDWNAYMLEIAAEENRQASKEREDRGFRRDRSGKPAKQLRDFVGQYHHPAYGTAEVTLVDDKLHWVWNNFRVPMQYYHGLEFDLPNRDLPTLIYSSQKKPARSPGFSSSTSTFPSDDSLQ